MRLYFSTPVWGDGHIELFKTIGLPSLLSPSNLPALAEPAQCRYFIYTRPQDVEQLKDCEAFRRLEGLIPVVIHLLPDLIELPYLIFAECNSDTLRRADEDDVAAVFLPPDCVWSDGSFANLQKLADAGKSVVHITGVRLNKDTAAPELVSRRDQNGSVLNIGARELTEFGLRNLHPVARSHFWREYDGALLPTNLYWTTPDQGLVIRCFHLHPLLVKSQIKFANFSGTIDDDLALSACPDPSTEYVVEDSDEILTFELSPPHHQVGGWPYSKNSVASVAAWAELAANARHRQLAAHTIRLHSTSLDRGVWAPAEAEAERVIATTSRLNESRTWLLALTSPKVFAWRGVAMLLGKGRFAGRRRGGLNAARRRLFARLPRLRALAHKLVLWIIP
jgi:hypothetical protein